MRDILVTMIVFLLVLGVFRSARLGAYLWAWLSIANPHRQTFGFARNMPFAQITAIVTLVCLFFSKDRRPFPVNSVTVVQLLFLAWMSFTTLFALNYPDIVYDRWIFVLKIHLMLFVTMMLVRGRDQITTLVWVVTLSVGYYGVKGGIFTILTGGGSRVWGPPNSLLEGNNELGVALTMVLPFMYFLYQTATRRLIRWGLTLGFILSCMAILGTQSRGALLAFLAMAAVLGLKGAKPVQTSILLIALVLAAITFMPDTWTARMSTIQTFDRDSSAMARVYTWQTLWNLALDRPFVGAGFATDSVAVFSRYAPVGGVTGYSDGGIFVAHSIYFQALGEHGFPGLALYLLLGVVTWRKASMLGVQAMADPEYATWVPLLMRAVQVSIAGFAVGGAFLTLVHLDVPYYMICYVALVDATFKERKIANANANRPSSIIAPA